MLYLLNNRLKNGINSITGCINMVKCEIHNEQMIKDKHESKVYLCASCNGITKEALKDALGVC